MALRRPLPIALLLTCALVAPARAADPTTGRLLVRMAGDGRAVAASGTVVARAGGRIARPGIPALGVVSVRTARGGSLAALARRLRGERGVRSVEAERRFTLRAAPDDPALTLPETAAGTPPGVPIEWWAEGQGLPAAWAVPQTHGATVAVIDTGVDASHPELAGRIVKAVDHDEDPSGGPATTDVFGHGTHVASLACATADNGIGLAGAAYGCRLLVFKSDLTDASVAASVVEATQLGAEAINMSFGTSGQEPASDTVRQALRYAAARGVVLVSAAADSPVEEQGDPSNVLQPAGTGANLAKGIGLSVTAANFAGQRATFAGYGSEVSLAAYGAWNTGTGGPRGLLGAFPAGTVALERPDAGPPASDGCACRTTLAGDSRYAYVQGTSMASPVVAGTAAMVEHLNPDLAAADVVRLLKTTARRPAGTGWEPNLGWGILDAGAAVAAARAIDKRAPIARIVGPLAQSTELTLRLSGADRGPAGVTRSGIAAFEVYRSIDGRPARLLSRTTSYRLRVTVRRGPRYAFSVLAVDRAGNRGRRDARPAVTLRLTPR